MLQSTLNYRDICALGLNDIIILMLVLSKRSGYIIQLFGKYSKTTESLASSFSLWSLTTTFVAFQLVVS